MMKNNTPKPHALRAILRHSALSTAVIFGLGSTAALADTEMEYEAGEGYHEEEWYDPGDWFNEDEQVSYESDENWADDNAWDDQSSTRDLTPIVYSHYYYWDPILFTWSDPQSESSNSKPKAKSSQRMETARLDGKVDGFRQINLRDQEGVESQHAFIKVTLKSGKSRVVSLGSNVESGDLDLEKGDSISVAGPVVKVDDRKIILANRIKTDGETFTIKDKKQPELASQERDREWKTSGKMVTRRGTLEEFAEVNLDNRRREDNLVVRLEMKNGRSCVADLGPGTKLSDLGLDEGDSIRIQGHPKQIDGKRLIVARKISVEGDPTRLRGSGKASDASGSGESASNANGSASYDGTDQASARND